MVAAMARARAIGKCGLGHRGDMGEYYDMDKAIALY
jgi:hypothetical protein